MRGLVQDVTIPALGMAMTGAVLTRWYKEPGETVAAGEAIAEIETDKSAVDLESPADGVLGLPARTFLEGFYWRCDFTLTGGRILHDYL